MKMMRRLFVRFSRDSSGSVTVEAVLVLPLLLWAYMATFVFYDAFKTRRMNQSAAYTISDMITRQTNTINIAYIEGLNIVYDYLSQTDRPTSIRVTSVFWDAAGSVYRVQWSYATGGKPIMVDANLVALQPKLPLIPVGDTLILMETNLDYTPAFDVGLVAHTFTEFIATRPRFVAQVPFSNT